MFPPSAGMVRHRSAADGAGPVGAQDVVGIFVVAAHDLTIGDKRTHTVRIDVIHFEMIVYVSALGWNGAASNADATHRRRVVQSPGNFVDAMRSEERRVGKE